MKNFSSILGLTTACLALVAAPHALANPGKGKGGKGGGGAPHADKGGKPDKDKPGKPDKDDKGDKGKPDKDHDCRFNDDERDSLRLLFGGGGKENPSNGHLPPGLAKKLREGKPLPPGWEKKLGVGNRIDNDLLSLLIPVSYDDVPRVRRMPGTRLYAHNDRLWLVREATREIVDMILFR